MRTSRWRRSCPVTCWSWCALLVLCLGLGGHASGGEAPTISTEATTARSRVSLAGTAGMPVITQEFTDLTRIINQITDTAALPAGGGADPGGSAGSEGLAGVRFLWDFGGGTTSTNESPAKVYGQPGNYAVSLRVDGEKGQSDLKVKPEFVVVGGGSAPRLGVRWLGGGAVLSVSGVVGKTYRIESTPSLGAGALWQTVATLTLGQPVQNWTDGQAGSARTRFYRAVLAP